MSQCGDKTGLKVLTIRLEFRVKQLSSLEIDQIG